MIVFCSILRKAEALQDIIESMKRIRTRTDRSWQEKGTHDLSMFIFAY